MRKDELSKLMPDEMDLISQKVELNKAIINDFPFLVGHYEIRHHYDIDVNNEMRAGGLAVVIFENKDDEERRELQVVVHESTKSVFDRKFINRIDELENKIKELEEELKSKAKKK